MVQCGSMAVFTINNCVGGGHNQIKLVAVAVLTVCGSFVFDLDRLPILHITLPVPAVHIPAPANTKILRHNKVPRNKNKQDENYDNKQRPQNMIAHMLPPGTIRF